MKWRLMIILSLNTEQNGNIDGSLERAFRYEVSSANGGLDEEIMDQVIAYVNSEIEEGRAAWLREQLGLGFDPSLDSLDMF